MAKSFFRVIKDHPDFLVIDKLPNIGFHCENDEAGIFEQVKQNMGVESLYPVHRLDKVTSGLLVFAKNAKTNLALCQQFKDKEVRKYYLAISEKKPSKKQGLIMGDMEPSRRGSYKLCPSLSNPAITQFFSQTMGEGRRLFLLRPHTGKTHQLRVALKSLGAAILGDPLYSDGTTNGDRTYLHAFNMLFELEGNRYSFQALPSEGEHFISSSFQQAVQSFLQPQSLPWPEIKKTQGTNKK